MQINRSKKPKGHLGGATPHYPAGTIPGQSAAGHHPFKSQAQWRLFFANPKLRRYAIGKAHATGPEGGVGYHSIPKRKGSTFKRVPLRPSGGKKKR